jgi:hypothetical protein
MYIQYHQIDTVSLYQRYPEERPMPILQIEHRVRDYAAWKAAFDSDPGRRTSGGVRSYQVYRPVDDSAYIAVDLVFDTRGEAETFKVGLEGLWRSPQALEVLGGDPQARIVDVVESRRY